ncbi:hypothetical protein L798_10192 [Zootermopsis nevadensis]|uniref:Uncharacterized protein n=1 Tax=Zootermopsis nevadensis TaxID=136037 RepID=A0A067R5C6_ZOONE|nr:hypothetical protein L798_10192 [Zootermopsis nevadensis]
MPHISKCVLTTEIDLSTSWINPLPALITQCVMRLSAWNYTLLDLTLQVPGDAASTDSYVQTTTNINYASTTIRVFHILGGQITIALKTQFATKHIFTTAKVIIRRHMYLSVLDT